MNKYLAHTLAFSTAAIAPSAIVATFDLRMAGAMAFYALANIILIAVPGYLLFRRLLRMTLPVCMLGGFIAAVLPSSVMLFPSHEPGSGASVIMNNVVTVQNGVLTTAGWLRYLYAVSMFGSIGAICAALFWVVLRAALGSNNSFKADSQPLRGRERP